MLPVHSLKRKSLSCGFLRSLGTSLRNQGVWSDFSSRPRSLKVQSEVNDGLFHGINEKTGPFSYKELDRKLAYHSPVLIDETFKLAYKELENESQKIYEEIKELNKSLENTKETSEKHRIKDEIDHLLILAESRNPEVMYNAEFNLGSVDKSHPVYRNILKKKWESYDLMVTMQRLEQLHVIPDTLPTLNPLVDVKVRFPHNVDKEFAGWVTPGEILPSFAVSQPPEILIQEFERTDAKNLYSVLIVNPDTPDVEKNSFTTTLQYGLANVPLDAVDNLISIKKLMEKGEEYTFNAYIPILPEKNASTQRACVWVFRQSKKLSIDGDISSDKFDIRFFVEQNGLLPVGAHVWRQHFDRSVNRIRSDYGLEKNRVFHRVRRPNPVIE
ncbi:uncharacterized protein PRCAT00001338001 [Priceomyces carsonii]|uniref:uncharacterized protein n=1 Tax=Priceomyces carsonii TaxID=28549 RepID=UPI002EDB22AF|nr:unnamed protein product [Priceomyces carsonii]